MSNHPEDPIRHGNAAERLKVTISAEDALDAMRDATNQATVDVLKAAHRRRTLGWTLPAHTLDVSSLAGAIRAHYPTMSLRDALVEAAAAVLLEVERVDAAPRWSLASESASARFGPKPERLDGM